MSWARTSPIKARTVSASTTLATKQESWSKAQAATPEPAEVAAKQVTQARPQNSLIAQRSFYSAGDSVDALGKIS